MQTDNQTPTSSARRRKSILLASAFAIGLTGALAGQVLVDFSKPAQAQITQAQDLSRDNNLRNNAPRQDQIGFADIVETVKPAVVSVRTKVSRESSSIESQAPGMFRNLPEGHPFRRFFEDQFPGDGDQRGPRQRPRQFGMSQGSGFFISEDGYVVTNNHVVANASEVELITDDSKTLQAKVVGTDPETDLALLKVEDGGKHPYVSLAPALPRIGDWVVAIGNPFGLGGTVTAGIVSAIGRDIGSGPYDSYLQIDAAVNRGNSGGPTFNLKGEVVGVNTAIYSQSGGNVGIAFAVPADVVANVIDSLRESGSVTRGWLGVGIQPVDEDMAEAKGLKEAGGALVSEVHSGTPAAKAGIRNADVILSLNGRKVEGPGELTRMVGGLKPGEKANLKVWRDGKETDVAVELGTRPGDLASLRNDNSGPGGQDGGAAPSSSVLDELGLSLEPSSDGEGVAISGVDNGSALAEKLRSGDVILEVNGDKVASPEDVAGAIESLQKNAKNRFATLRVKSSNGTRYVAIPLKS